MLLKTETKCKIAETFSDGIFVHSQDTKPLDKQGDRGMRHYLSKEMPHLLIYFPINST